MAIAIVDYMGNLHSVGKAVERLGYEALVTGDRRFYRQTGSSFLALVHLAMPWSTCGRGLDAVVKEAAAGTKPLLGICLGMQLLFSSSEEHGEHTGLDILPGKVVRFAAGEGTPYGLESPGVPSSGKSSL